ncbi:hypothetical protein AARAC_008193 [Aspergillus arachidicola]|uniref:Heterokaryon incompatibility domain-containing protein n=1 Tax=Aspergillus arachidicola TaxID=656916 RepID=A0A2G7G6K3_9EURO|nr:hypothetical protein AARAC_008193 [Aspergillus arachidicola]
MLVQTLERDHKFDKREDPSIIIGMNLEEDEDFLLERGVDFQIRVYTYGWMELSKFYGLRKSTSKNRQLLQPEPEPDVNWGVICDWLQDCCANHKGDVNKEADSTIVPQMRVIDVEEGCVVMAPPHCKYASLSYVWGKPSDQDLSARTENITNLEKKGYLFKNPPTATVHDAMVACAKLGLRYLWTDRLCILQDAIQDKHTQVNAMDVIYSCSVVTLVALAGVDAHYGLPGVHMRKNSTANLRDTGWTTRGWTFQEAVLSPRLLYFPNDGVYFECCHEPFVKDENAFLHPNVTRDRCKGQFNLSSSNDLVKQYTQRSLTYKTDILNAFSGILNAKYGPYHHFGISLHKFDKEILWQYGPGAHIPRTPPSGGIFPSWAWCTMDQATGYSFRGFVNLSAAPLALWGLVESDDTGKHSLRFFQYENPQAWQTWDDVFAQYAALAVIKAWNEGCYPGQLSTTLLHLRISYVSPAPVRRIILEILKFLSRNCVFGFLISQTVCLRFSAGTWKQIMTCIMSTWSSLYDLCKTAHEVDSSDYDSTCAHDPNTIFPPHCIELGSKLGRILVSTQFVRLPLERFLASTFDLLAWRNRKEDGCKVFVEGCGLDMQSWRRIQKSTPNIQIDVLALSLELYPHSNTAWHHPRSPSENILCEELSYWCDSAGQPLYVDTLNQINSDDGSTLTDYTPREECNNPSDGEESNHDPNHGKPRYALFVNVMIVETKDGESRRIGIGKTSLKLWTKGKPELGTFVLK